MVTDTGTRPTFDLASACGYEDAVRHSSDLRQMFGNVLQELSRANVGWQDLISTSASWRELASTSASAWRDYLGAFVEGLQTSVEPTDPTKMDEARRRADLLSQIDALLRDLGGGAEPAIESAAHSRVQRLSDFLVPTDDDFLDDSWEPVPVQHVRAATPVRASISLATPRPFEAD